MPSTSMTKGQGEHPPPVEIATPAPLEHGKYACLMWEDQPGYLVVGGHPAVSHALAEMRRGFVEDDYGEPEDFAGYESPVAAWASWEVSEDDRWDHVLRLWRQPYRLTTLSRWLPEALARRVLRIETGRFPVMVSSEVDYDPPFRDAP